MKISFDWLSQYIDLNDYRSRIGELCDILTQAGLEVESVEDQSKDFQNVVIGHLLEVGKHPDADKLTLCKVDTGDSEPRQIVCGAKNHKTGDYVVAALPGAVLPGDFAIKKSKIRGVESLGMLCSQKELGLSSDGEGIITLKEGKPGQPFSEAFGKNDILIEINVTPNRADCLSHLGLAQELSTLLDRPVKRPTANLKTGDFATSVRVKLENSDLCPRYAGRSVKGVKVGPSPSWLVQRLESVGLRSINNIVDVTNFVMLEYGQPLHAFDASQIQGGEIIVRNSQKGEAFTTLDGTDLTLTGEELVIADQKRAVALAGVVGGKNSGVSESTQELFVESAFFNAQGVRRTSRRFGFETDSSYRFARGVNPEQTAEALQRACDLMVQVGGGQVAKDQIDQCPQPLKKSAINVDVKMVAQRLGYEVSVESFQSVMRRLGCKVEANQVTPPSHRWDLTIPEDLVEEYARVYGYDKLDEKVPALLSEPTTHTSEYVQIRQVTDLLVGQGFSQAVNYAFLNASLQKSVLGETETAIALKNPLSEDFAVMRQSLLPSLLQNLSHNARHGNEFGSLFEVGRQHFQRQQSYSEDLQLGFVLWGEEQALWAQKIAPVYRLKSHLENLLKAINPKAKWQWRTKTDVAPLFHPSQSAELVYQGKSIGVLGTLHPQVAKDFKIKTSAAFAEIQFTPLFQGAKALQFKNIPAFPAVEKDLAFVVPKSLKSSEVQKEITKAGGQLLQSVKVVDLFEGGNLPADQRSLSFRMVFQSPQRTLSDEEVMTLFNGIISSVTQKLNVQLR